MKVLIVEDEKVTARLMIAILEKDSIEVEAVGSAKAALDYLGKGEFVDVIVSDVMMPGMDGFTFIRQLKADRRLCKIPVVLCTTLGDKASLVKGIEVGIAGYVVKPVKHDVLIPKLRAVEEQYSGVVLAVDDERLVLDLLERNLKRDGYRVITAQTGAEAIELLKDNKVTLVISDIVMPEMDGFEVLANIKENYPSVPVILMSGRADQNREDIIATGADDFIPKPFHNTEVLARVRIHYK